MFRRRVGSSSADSTRQPSAITAKMGCAPSHPTDAAPPSRKAVRQPRLHLRIETRRIPGHRLHRRWRVPSGVAQPESLPIVSHLKKALGQMPVESAILDGEVVCLDSRGVSQFNQLLSQRSQPIFYAFDLLYLDGEDLRNCRSSSENSIFTRSSRKAVWLKSFTPSTSRFRAKRSSRKFVTGTWKAW